LACRGLCLLTQDRSEEFLLAFEVFGFGFHFFLAGLVGQD
jgi:hypothetical protein